MAAWTMPHIDTIAAALGFVPAFRSPLHTALTVSASLSQIGEFSFILVVLVLVLVLVGYGRVGRRVVSVLAAHDNPSGSDGVEP